MTILQITPLRLARILKNQFKYNPNDVALGLKHGFSKLEAMAVVRLLADGQVYPELSQEDRTKALKYAGFSEVDEFGPLYQELEQLLAAAARGETGEWQVADRATWNLLLKITHREQQRNWMDMSKSDQYPDVDIINAIPCKNLKRIDQLWLKYSDARFGFSVQKKIYLEECGQLERSDYTSACNFGKRVGWYAKDSWIRPEAIKFAASAPEGHLPVSGVFTVLSWDDWAGILFGIRALYARLRACEHE